MARLASLFLPIAHGEATGMNCRPSANAEHQRRTRRALGGVIINITKPEAHQGPLGPTESPPGVASKHRPSRERVPVSHQRAANPGAMQSRVLALVSIDGPRAVRGWCFLSRSQTPALPAPRPRHCNNPTHHPLIERWFNYSSMGKMPNPKKKKKKKNHSLKIKRN